MILLIADTYEQGRYYAKRDYPGERCEVVTYRNRDRLRGLGKGVRLITVGTFPRHTPYPMFQEVYGLRAAAMNAGASHEYGAAR